jgi:hypothetical protein
LEQWIELVKEHWVVFVLALIALFVVVKVVKTVIKWVLVLAIIGLVILYSGITMNDLKSVGSQVIDTVKEEALNVMISEMKDAQYRLNEDGTFTVVSNNIELTGEPGADAVTVTFKGQKIGSLRLDETIQNFIEQAKSNSSP